MVGSGDVHRRMYLTLAGAGGLALGNMTSNVGHLKVSAIRSQSHEESFRPEGYFLPCYTLIVLKKAAEKGYTETTKYSQYHGRKPTHTRDKGTAC